MVDAPEPSLPELLKAVRQETMLTEMVAIMHWRVEDVMTLSIDGLHWIVRLAGLTEPEVQGKARQVMARLQQDAKALKKLQQEHAAIWRALVHDQDKGMRLSDEAMKTMTDLRTRLAARYEEVEALLSEADRLHGVTAPPQTHM